MDGTPFHPNRWLKAAAPLLLILVVTTGCQTAQPVAVRRLINHQAMLDFSGLKSAERFDEVKAQIAPPQSWKQMAAKRGPFYTDVQWRSPSGTAAIGVAYVRMPLPLGPRTLLRFARGHYARQSDDGQMLTQWTDSLGRNWFEAENNKYRVRGFIVTRGFEAWIAYSGYKTTMPADLSELAMGARAMETIVPGVKAKRDQVAAAVEDD